MTPLILHDNTRIDTDTGEVIRVQEVLPAGYEEVPTNTAAVELVAQTTRRISDLPDKPDNLHPVAIILTYHLFGLSNEQIAIATDTNVEYVVGVMESEPFNVMKNTIADDVTLMQQNTMMGILEGGARTAATKQVSLISSQDEAVALAASKQVIDRVEKRSTTSDRKRMPSLNITIVSDDGKSDMNIKIGDS